MLENLDDEKTLKHLMDYYEDEIIVRCLVNYYDMCKKPTRIDNTFNEFIEPDQDLLWAIERVLQDFMTYNQFEEWRKNR